jgi:hypothetical protein
MNPMRTLVTLLMLALLAIRAQAADELPIFDTHIHYSHDAWQGLPPKEAIALLKRAGVKRALVSSADDDGTLMLLREAPEMIVPELSPYRKRGEFDKWMRDPGNYDYIAARIAKAPYVSIGEFHVYGKDADLPVVKRTIALARKHKLVLHAHSDAAAVERMFVQAPEIRVLWAHAGFEPLGRVLDMMRKHKSLWADLAVRGDPGMGGKVHPDWRAAFEELPDRFMLGTDTYAPERWHYVEPHARWARAWLADLPRELAEKIAWRNADALFPWCGTGRVQSPCPQTSKDPQRQGMGSDSGSAAMPASVVTACGAALGPSAMALQSERYVAGLLTAPPRIEIGKPFRVELAVCPRDGAPAPERVEVDAHMPDHRHGMNYRATTMRAGAGRWAAEGLMLHMPGKWEIVVDVAAGGRTDRLAKVLVIE